MLETSQIGGEELAFWEVLLSSEHILNDGPESEAKVPEEEDIGEKGVLETDSLGSWDFMLWVIVENPTIY